jgi:hypothetical protein
MAILSQKEREKQARANRRIEEADQSSTPWTSALPSF